MTALENNLPPQPTPFIGRQAELAEIVGLLGDPACRLLTLSGPGGIGKTRLAVQAAARALESFPDGVYFVPLQPVSSIDFLIPAIAEGIRLSFHSSASPRAQLLDALRQKKILLILDNFEHLLAETGLIPEMLNAAPLLKILVTSREVLELQEEWVRPVAGLEYPEEAWSEVIETYSAVELFQDRARQIQPGFSLSREWACVVRICRLVQGMPLAIELAAAWLRSLPCAEIAGEIQSNLDFLATVIRNVPERHRSLRAVFEQTWKMLSNRQQEAFMQLSVFQGGFERQAAQSVAGASLHSLHTLVDKSLLRVTPSGRYEIHAVLRQFAQEKLADRPADLHKARQKHCETYVAFLEQKEVELKGGGQARALAAIDHELDNLRVAWRFAIEQGDEQAIRRSMGSLLIYYHARTRLEEGAEAFHRAIARWEGPRSALLGDLYLHAGWFESVIGRGPTAVLLYRKGLEFLGHGEWQPSTPMALVAMNFLSWLTDQRGWTKEQAHALFQQVSDRSEQGGDRWGMAWMAYSLGLLAFYEEDDLPECERRMQRSAEIFREVGDLWATTFPLHHLGVLYEKQKKYLEARSIFHETLAILRQVGDAGGVEFALGQLSSLAAREQDYAQSWRYSLEAIRLAQGLRRELSMTFHLFELGELLYRIGQSARTVEIYAFLLTFTPYEGAQAYIRENLDRLMAELTPAVFESAWRRGEALTYNALIDSLSRDLAAAALPAPAPPALPAAADAHSQLPEALSPRELEVLKLAALGLSNREIARKLVVTEGTVKKHLNNIFGKLQAGSRTQAVARARELSLLQD